MDEKQIRIQRLKSEISRIHQHCYPERLHETKEVMLEALRERVRMIEELNCQDYLPSSQRG
jgi:hypothetical protein